LDKAQLYQIVHIIVVITKSRWGYR